MLHSKPHNMIPLLEDIEKDSATWHEKCLRFGNVLGLDHPVPGCVLRRARADDSFAARLMICRNSSELLRQVIFDPANQSFRGPEEIDEVSPLQGSVKLLKALGRWVVKGAEFTSPEVHGARLRVCQTCPHLVEPPVRLVYRVALVGASDPRVCNLCGCAASRKARLVTETCPAKYW